ncbi:peptidoglycan-binding protein [Streptomyces sp. NPDC088910]|uniref:peptidoglycan-binding domain-containing protein n=1 Tax=Streptomyces sp. NPDC088910 TaxID=3365911 RepID=UPI003800BC35
MNDARPTRAAPSRPLDRRTLLRYGTGALAGAGPAPAAAAYGWPASLQQGSSGAAVTELQIRIAGWAADAASHTDVGVDGSFGPGTYAALRRYQAAYGLGVDGVAGPQTFASLNALKASDGSMSGTV